MNGKIPFGFIKHLTKPVKHKIKYSFYTDTAKCSLLGWYVSYASYLLCSVLTRFCNIADMQTLLQNLSTICKSIFLQQCYMTRDHVACFKEIHRLHRLRLMSNCKWHHYADKRYLRSFTHCPPLFTIHLAPTIKAGSFGYS